MTKTVVYDIETRDYVTALGQNFLKYQLDAIDKMAGINPGAMQIFSYGRRTGKSMMNMKVLKNRYYDTNLCKEILLPMHPEPKYKFSRAKWYTVNIGIGMWKLGREYNEIIAWCTEQFGPHPTKPDAWSRWKVGIGQMYFRDEADYILYQLKWA